MISISEALSIGSLAKKEMDAVSFQKTISRLLKLECRYNLSVLNLIKDDVNQFSKSHLELFPLLESEKIEFFILNKNLQDSALLKIKDLFLKEDNDNKSGELLENILLKIKILKAISKLSDENEYKKFQLKRRAKNLIDKLNQLNELLGKKRK